MPHPVPAALLLAAAAAAADGDGPFGHALLPQFSFPAGWTNLNQGSYGAIPRAIQQAREGYQREMDASPEAFFRCNFTGDGHTRFVDLVNLARGALAAYLGVDVDDIVLVENASHGINAILRSLHLFLQGRSVLYLDTAYGMVKSTLDFLAGRRAGEPASPSVRERTVEVATTDLMPGVTRAGIVARVEAALAAQAPGSVGLCAFSHITSVPALVLPVKQLIAACRAAGALTMLDGAHAPGHIPLNLTDVGADFYVGNGHKWLFSPKGSAFIHVRPEVQRLVYPLVIDGFFPGDPTPFTKSFMWQGTEDPSAFIAIKDAIAWRAGLGEEAALRWMRETGERGGAALEKLWGTERLPTDPDERAAMQSGLVNVRVPCGLRAAEPACPGGLAALVATEAGTFVPIGAFAGAGRGTWARVSAALYVEEADFTRFGDAVLRILRGPE